MNEQPNQNVPEANDPSKTNTSRGVTLKPISDMSEFEPKPYAPVAAQESISATSVSEPVPMPHAPVSTPYDSLSLEEKAKADADIARRMPKLRVVERVPLLKLYLILSVILLSFPLIFTLYNLSRMNLSASQLITFGPAAFMLVAPAAVTAAVTIFLFITKSVKAATVILTIMLVLGAISLFLEVANQILLLTKGFNLAGNFLGTLVAGLLLYFLYRVRQATAAADRQ
ncbi:MAG TPA: hypothetical protein VGO98_01995 [Candidatus Saccharimonadales bacterium]|jgi:hypothetical protein|nr:hypothetical protein [Candidatus Saccharimonadales bacterium]